MNDAYIEDMVLEHSVDGFWDLNELRPVSTAPRRELEIRKFINGDGGFTADEEFKSGIEGRINEFFLDRKMELLPNFKSLPIWKNFEYIVTLIDPTKNHENEKFNYDGVVGLLLAFTIQTGIGKVRLYGVIGIQEKYRGSGHLKDLIGTARNIDEELTRGQYPMQKVTVPAGLRTSWPKADAGYSKHSDYRILTDVNSDGHGDGPYIVHLFGFKNQFTGQPIREYTSKMYEVAYHIANLPPFFIKLDTLK